MLTGKDAYFCATVLHAGRLCARVDSELEDDDSLQQTFQKCIHILRKYEIDSTSARICRNALETLERKAFPSQGEHRSLDVLTAVLT